MRPGTLTLFCCFCVKIIATGCITYWCSVSLWLKGDGFYPIGNMTGPCGLMQPHPPSASLTLGPCFSAKWSIPCLFEVVFVESWFFFHLHTCFRNVCKWVLTILPFNLPVCAHRWHQKERSLLRYPFRFLICLTLSASWRSVSLSCSTIVRSFITLAQMYDGWCLGSFYKRV